MSVPAKYRSMGDFHAYYSGNRIAPYLTIFVGGNHEASAHLFELYYGGWVAPNIYYLGAANVLRLGPLRIAGLSGIWKGPDYRKPHHERLPYSYDNIKSAYHVREWDVRKLLLLRSQVDVGLSHDWPQGVEWCGDWKTLLREKSHFEPDARSGKLGSVAARQVMQRLRPRWWFAAHMHVRFAAVVKHGDAEEKKNAEGSSTRKAAQNQVSGNQGEERVAINDEEIEVDLDGIDSDERENNGSDRRQTSIPANEEEIKLDLEDLDEQKQPSITQGIPKATRVESNGAVVSNELRAQLPEAFRRDTAHTGDFPARGGLPFPDAIKNRSTNFLALDKCLPNRKFLQLSELDPISEGGGRQHDRPLQLTYDKEWLAITRVFAKDLIVGDPKARVARDQGEAHYRAQIDEEEKWVEENVVAQGKLGVPSNFQITAPPWNPATGLQGQHQQPTEYTNPHTSEFCSLLGIPNPFHLSPELRAERMRRAPPPSQFNHSSERGGRGGGRGWRGGRGGRGRGH